MKTLGKNTIKRFQRNKKRKKEHRKRKRGKQKKSNLDKKYF